MNRSETAGSEATVIVGGAFNKGNIRRFLLSPTMFTLPSLLHPAVGQSDHISVLPLPSHRQQTLEVQTTGTTQSFKAGTLRSGDLEYRKARYVVWCQEGLQGQTGGHVQLLRHQEHVIWTAEDLQAVVRWW